jgi:hypothetical protein
MMGRDRQTMEIRSYRAVFDLERRIYRIDRLRLNPGGVPVRGVVYLLALLAATLLAGRLLLVAALVRMLPWYVVDLALPSATAALLSVIKIEGRPFHLAAQALLRHRLGPRRLAGLRACRSRARGQVGAGSGARWWPEEIVLLPDGSDAWMRKLRYTGRGAVIVTVAHAHAHAERRRKRLCGLARQSQLTLRQLPDGETPAIGQVIALAPNARLLVEARRSAAVVRRGTRREEVSR